MSELRDLLTENQTETVRIKAVLIPISVLFKFPEAVRESVPMKTIKAIEGVRILRFYTAPVPGDVIQFRGHLFSVIGRHHECQVRGSSRKDQMPIVITQYMGEMVAPLIPLDAK